MGQMEIENEKHRAKDLLLKQKWQEAVGC
jgi:hypothetical protein